jgi:hypothetical protein
LKTPAILQADGSDHDQGTVLIRKLARQTSTPGI